MHDKDKLDEWQPLSIIAELYPQFSLSQLKRLILIRDQLEDFREVYCKVGRRFYINIPKFEHWISIQKG